MCLAIGGCRIPIHIHDGMIFLAGCNRIPHPMLEVVAIIQAGGYLARLPVRMPIDEAFELGIGYEILVDEETAHLHVVLRNHFFK